LNEITSKFRVDTNKNISIDNELRLVIGLNANETSKDLIQFLNEKAQINHFTEIIPSANDIFLKAVANNG